MKDPDLKISQALNLLELIKIPADHLDERSALTLLALLNLPPNKNWRHTTNPLLKITQMMDWMTLHYDVQHARTARDHLRRKTVQQFVQMGILCENPDQPDRPKNSSKWCYQIEPTFLKLAQGYKNTKQWYSELDTYLKTSTGFNKFKSKNRELPKIAVTLGNAHTIELTDCDHSILLKTIIEKFRSRYCPHSEVLRVKDADEQYVIDEADQLIKLNINLDTHQKTPDVIIHDNQRNWLIIVDAVTPHSPIDQQRRNEIKDLFADANIGIVYVTAFHDTASYIGSASSIGWKTEVWIASEPDQLIHYNGATLIGPNED
jgi:adenine-specific DNA-methyltransferase